jgi:hypothetical protein
MSELNATLNELAKLREELADAVAKLKAASTVHHLQAGQATCGAGVPGVWPAGDLWSLEWTDVSRRPCLLVFHTVTRAADCCECETYDDDTATGRQLGATARRIKARILALVGKT